MTKAGYTHAVLVVDRSGSMSTTKADAEGGINTFIEEQKKVPGKLTFTLYDFDTVFQRFIGPKDIQDVGTYKLLPRGMTALLDAIGRSLTETGEYLAAMKEKDRPENVLVAIVTDGGENSSKEWTKERVQALIKQQQDKYNWVIQYLSSDLDSVNEAKALGIALASPSDVTFSGTYGNLSSATSSLRAGSGYNYQNTGK